MKGLWEAADRAHAREAEFRATISTMARRFIEAEQGRAAATVYLYLGDLEQAARASDDPRDQARVCLARKDTLGAAKHFQEHGWLAHAALVLEDAGRHREARVLWERLVDSPRLADEPYTKGLVQFNLARACDAVGDKLAARRAKVRAMHLLEAAADGFQTVGLRERAFDCYQVLISLGREGAFENLAEGYLGCIRILTEDNLKYYVLQYFEDFQELALERQELHAAATLFREAALYCRQHRLPYENWYRRRAAETQVAAAEQLVRQGMTKLAENAYASAIDLWSELGMFSEVRQIYRALSGLEGLEDLRDRYQRLEVRLAQEPDENPSLVRFPDYLRIDTAYPEIWRLDVIEWEQDGDAAETVAEILADPKWPEFTRRRALLCRLFQLGALHSPPTDEELAELATRLAKVEVYATLAPLERLMTHESKKVRAAVVKAAAKLHYKRTFSLVTAGLADGSSEVQRHALGAISHLHFGHAFDPLQRIYRRSTDRDVRRAALSSIGRIPSLESAELLIDAMRQGTPDEQELVEQLLVQAEHVEVDALLLRAIASEGETMAGRLEAVRRRR